MKESIHISFKVHHFIAFCKISNFLRWESVQFSLSLRTTARWISYIGTPRETAILQLTEKLTCFMPYRSTYLLSK
uniref:Uncharacterized protein n=1 Tax=Onchocerca volvulus TaxID=6282 RepID=A0A8R1XLT3_ONCVO